MQQVARYNSLEFPCDFTFKVVGAARADLIDDVVQTAHKTIKGDYTPTMKESGKGTYHSFQSRCVQTILNRLKRFTKHWQKLKAFAWCYSKIGGIKFIIPPIFIIARQSLAIKTIRYAYGSK